MREEYSEERNWILVSKLYWLECILYITRIAGFEAIPRNKVTEFRTSDRRRPAAHEVAGNPEGQPASIFGYHILSCC
jgi:hypothetical protein